jgi:uncharacterized protein
VRITPDTPTGPAWIDLERPPRARVLVALTHGASGSVGTRDVLAVRDALLPAGVAVALITQPYRVAERRTPPQGDQQDAAWLAVLAALRRRRGFATLPLVVGGRSNGARVAARTAADAGADAVVALAFPTHPPGRPERSRLDELAAAAPAPILVVQGERDPFGVPPADPRWRLEVIPGADHALRRDLPRVAGLVRDFVLERVD